MKTYETATPVRVFDRAYINGQFVTPHGTQVVDLVNPTDNKVIGKVTMADEIDARKAIGGEKEAFHTFSQSSKEDRMELLLRLHDAVAKRMDQLVEATVVEYGAPQDRAKGSNSLAANIFLHFKKVLEDFELVKTVGTSKVVMEPAGVVGIFTPWNSSAGSIAIKLAPAIAAGCAVVIKPSEMSAMQTEVLMDAFHEAGMPPGVINVVTGLGEVVGTELTKSPDIMKKRVASFSLLIGGAKDFDVDDVVGSEEERIGEIRMNFKNRDKGKKLNARPVQPQFSVCGREITAILTQT